MSVNKTSVAELRTEFGLQTRFPVLCTVGMLVWREKVLGVERLLESLAYARERLPSVVLLVVGDGGFRPMLESRARDLAVEDLVRFVGMVPNPAPFLHASDIICHISFRDSFAQSVREGMAAGKPVILNDSYDFPEPTEQWGLVKTTSNPEEIAETIFELAGDDNLREVLGKRGKSAVLARYSWSETAKSFLRLYDLTA